MSYLLFTSKYTNALIDLGYSDAGKRIDEIEDLLYAPAPESVMEEAEPVEAGEEQPVPEEIAQVVEDPAGDAVPAAGDAAVSQSTFDTILAAIKRTRSAVSDRFSFR